MNQETIEALESELTRLRELLDRVKVLVIDDMPQGQTGYADAVDALENKCERFTTLQADNDTMTALLDRVLNTVKKELPRKSHTFQNAVVVIEDLLS